MPNAWNWNSRELDSSSARDRKRGLKSLCGDNELTPAHPCQSGRRGYSGIVKGKLALPLALMIVFALSRIPGMLPHNFSAAYALAFCAGVYFAGRMAWWLPLATLLITDIGLDLYYRF